MKYIINKIKKMILYVLIKTFKFILKIYLSLFGPKTAKGDTLDCYAKMFAVSRIYYGDSKPNLPKKDFVYMPYVRLPGYYESDYALRRRIVKTLKIGNYNGQI